MIAAIIPAAGKSTRMGQAKLLLKVEFGLTLIGSVTTALYAGGASPVIVVAPPVDDPAERAITYAAREAGAKVIIAPTRPAEMRKSVELALAELESTQLPEAVLLTPGDNPGLSADDVARLIERWRISPDRIVVPTAGGRRVHPILLPWTIAALIPSLPAGLGINTLVTEHASEIVVVDVGRPNRVDDLDTPEDLERWRASRSGFNSPGPLTVKLFAVARQVVGRDHIEIDLSPSTTVGELRERLAAECPALGPMLKSMRIAIDSEYVPDDTMLQANSKVALIPPVSGGC